MHEPLNPYATSSAESYALPETKPASLHYKLYSPRSVCIATFFGSLLAGGVILAINYWRMNRTNAAIQAMVWSVLGMLALFAASVFTPDGTGMTIAFLVAPAWIMYAIAAHLQGDALIEHKRAGGPFASAWAAFAISMLVVIFLGVVFAGGILLMALFGMLD